MPGDEGEPAARIFRGSRSDFLPPKGESSVERGGEGGIRTLDGGIHPHNALAGRRLQPLGHFSAPARGYPTPRPASGYASPSSEGWQSGRMRRSRKPFRALGSDEGSNPSPSAQRRKRRISRAPTRGSTTTPPRRANRPAPPTPARRRTVCSE